MEDAAGRLRAIAGGLHGLLAPLVGMSRRVWKGPAADDFEVMAGRHGRIVDEQSARIGRIAGEFIVEAAQLRSVARSLDATASVVVTALPGGLA